MKLSKEHLGKLVTFNSEGFDGYDTGPYEFYLIPVSAVDWYDFIDLSNVGFTRWKDVIQFVTPLPTLGCVLQLGEPFPNVNLNYAKVLFPKMAYHDPDNHYLAHPIHIEVPAGVYWVSGDMLSLIEE